MQTSYNASNGMNPIAGRELRVTINRRAVLTGLAGGAMLSRTEARGQDANYPSRAVRIGVGTGAGGAADTTARVAAKIMPAASAPPNVRKVVLTLIVPTLIFAALILRAWQADQSRRH